MPKYAIGIDFGTESGQCAARRCRRRPRSRHLCPPLRQRRDRRAPYLASMPAAYDWSRIGRCKTRTTTSRSSSRAVPAVLKDSGVSPAVT